MANELDATQGEPDGVAAAIPGNDTAPEQNENEQHDNTNETDASAEGSAEHDAQGEGEGGEEGSDAGKEGEGESQKRNKLPWYQKRINEETNRRRELDRRLQEYEAEIQRLKSGAQPDTADQSPDLDTLVDRRAQEKLQQQALQQRTNAFDATGAKEFGREAFNESCNLVASLLDPREIGTFMDVLTDPEVIQDGHKVVMELANDPEEAERILRLPPVKRTAALLRLADRISQPPKPSPKPISKAPAPVTPVGGNTKPASVLDNPEASQEDFDRELKKMVFGKKR